MNSDNASASSSKVVIKYTSFSSLILLFKSSTDVHFTPFVVVGSCVAFYYDVRITFMYVNLMYVTYSTEKAVVIIK